MRISDWSSDVCSSDLARRRQRQAGEHGKAGTEGGRDPLRRAARRHRQVVGLGPVEQQEEGVQLVDAAGRPWGVRRTVEIGVGDDAPVQRGHSVTGALLELIDLAELDRLGRAYLGAGRLHAALQPVVAERALMRLAVALIQARKSTRTNSSN